MPSARALALLAALLLTLRSHWAHLIGYPALGALASLFVRYAPLERRMRIVGRHVPPVAPHRPFSHELISAARIAIGAATALDTTLGATLVIVCAVTFSSLDDRIHLARHRPLLINVNNI